MIGKQLLLIRSSNQGQLPNDPKALFGGRDKKSSKQAFRIMEEDLDNCFLEAVLKRNKGKIITCIDFTLISSLTLLPNLVLIFLLEKLPLFFLIKDKD